MLIAPIVGIFVASHVRPSKKKKVEALVWANKKTVLQLMESKGVKMVIAYEPAKVRKCENTFDNK